MSEKMFWKEDGSLPPESYEAIYDMILSFFFL